MNSINKISIAARITLDAHSLNNEGSDGNRVQTRMMNVIAQDGSRAVVNAVSGDVIKHAQAKHLQRIATATGLKLSEGARLLNANRLNHDIAAELDSAKEVWAAEGSPAGIIDASIRACAVTDMEGLMITQVSPSVGRKSVIEVGWMIGVPGLVHTDEFLHVKYVPADPTNSPNKNGDGGDNNKQNLFHRPASSGVYALVMDLDIGRIGFNDITQTYAIDSAERSRRMKALLESAMLAVIDVDGAMRATQAPHIVNMIGVVSVSYSDFPAPRFSPLRDDFADRIEKTANELGAMRGDSIKSMRFAEQSELISIIGNLIKDGQPFSLAK